MRMKPSAGSPSARLVSTMSAEALAANLETRLRTTLAALECCQASLARDAEHETADLLSVAILQLRMKLKGVTDCELKLLCEAAQEQAPTPRNSKRTTRRRRCGRPVLKLVK
jgi:hypothetical protein